MSMNVRRSQNPMNNVTHHGLVKLLVCDALVAMNKIWESLFLEALEKAHLEEKQEEIF